MSADPRFEAMEERVYRRLFDDQDTPEEVIASFVEESENETLAEMAVASAYERRHEEALAGKLDYLEWLSAVSRDMSRSGSLVLALGVASAIAAGLALYGFTQMIPTGERFKFSYYVVSILAGGFVFLCGSAPLYSWLHRNAMSDSEGRDDG